MRLTPRPGAGGGQAGSAVIQRLELRRGRLEHLGRARVLAGAGLGSHWPHVPVEQNSLDGGRSWLCIFTQSGHFWSHDVVRGVHKLKRLLIGSLGWESAR